MGEHDLFQKIGFIGLGLIGGSIAKKIHTLYPDVTIIATAGHQKTITEAYGEHLISNQNLCEIKDFYDCDYIFLCTPVKRNIEYLRQLKGNIKDKISEMREKILYHTAFIETALDDPEHISVDGYGETLKKVVDEIMEAMKRLLDSCDDGRIIKEGVRTVILGKPNAGKSSLLNVLLGEDRAIVTDIAGTTRDVLEEHLNLKGISLNIMDTAGIRDTEDVVEKIGVDRAKEYADKADLILYVIDASRPLDENDAEILHLIKGKRAIILLNKSDLDMQVTKEQEELPEEFPVIEISAKNVQGIEELEDTLKEMFFQGELTFNDEIYITNVRQKTALQDAYAALERVNDSIAADMPEDFYSIDLMDAYEALGNITGETIGEDLVNEIFSKFCMGK